MAPGLNLNILNQQLSTQQKTALQQLGGQLEGEFFFDDTMRVLYATDASAYRELPMGVAIPRTVDDLKKLIRFAQAEKTSLIPRTAGTSLAGQVVGNGIVVDVSKYFNRILELNAKEGWVRVQPGVVRDELNLFLQPHGLFFGPETSTANRAMIGGMVGNNSCGSNSVVYRSTREHLLEVKALLSDGSEAEFKSIGLEDFHQKCEGETLEANIYRTTRRLLSNYENQQEIRQQFPKKTVERRNTGYAIDALLDSAPFTAGEPDFNFCKLRNIHWVYLLFLSPVSVAGSSCSSHTWLNFVASFSHEKQLAGRRSGRLWSFSVAYQSSDSRAVRFL